MPLVAPWIIAVLPDPRYKVTINAEVRFFKTVPELITFPLNHHVRRKRVKCAAFERIKVQYRYLDTNNSSPAQTKKINIESRTNHRADCPKPQEVSESVRHPMHMNLDRN